MYMFLQEASPIAAPDTLLQYGALGLLAINLGIGYLERKDERRTRAIEAESQRVALELAREVQRNDELRRRQAG